MVSAEEQLAAAEAEVTGQPSPNETGAVSSPVKRGPGRPRKSESAAAQNAGISGPGAASKRSHHKKPDSAPAPAPALATNREARKDLASAYRGLWDTLAAVFDDDELKVSDAEVEAWSEPAARTVEQFGLESQTKKLAPITLAGVTVAQARPRIVRMALKQRQGSPGPGRPKPVFRRQPEPNTEPPGTVIPGDYDPGIGFGNDRPIPLNGQL